MRDRSSDVAAVKGVAANAGFRMDCSEVCADGLERGLLRAKSVQLRMIAVSACFSSDDGLRQQRLALKRNQALGIEILRVQ
jgi:hypothetical protein